MHVDPTKCFLKIGRWGGHSRDELSVVDTNTGTAIPFEWVDLDTIAVDVEYADVAAITPRPRHRSA